MLECYSVFGPEPRLPSCMLHSYLLTLKLNVTSITVWCRILRETPLYAILSDFSFGDTPSVGSFYDFFTRLWKDDSNNPSPKDHFPKLKPAEEKRKGTKLLVILPVSPPDFFHYRNAGNKDVALPPLRHHDATTS